MQQDDFITSVIETVADVVPLSKPARAKIDDALRAGWRGVTVYVAAKSPTRRQAIRDATGTYEQIAAAFGVSTQTVYRIRKGR